MQIWTVNEQDCYDAGFANGGPYWRALEQDRIFEAVNKWLTEPIVQPYLNHALPGHPVFLGPLHVIP